MAIQSSPSCLCALLCALLIAPAACYTGAVASRRGAVRTCRVRALEPISTALAGGTAAAAFAAGLVPPSLLLLSKDGEIREAKAEAADANAEVKGEARGLCTPNPWAHAAFGKCLRRRSQYVQNGRSQGYERASTR
eukprot:3972948-Prymnesium_polylepis.1